MWHVGNERRERAPYTSTGKETRRESNAKLLHKHRHELLFEQNQADVDPGIAPTIQGSSNGQSHNEPVCLIISLAGRCYGEGKNQWRKGPPIALCCEH
jgi:hypothetical protein